MTSHPRSRASLAGPANTAQDHSGGLLRRHHHDMRLDPSRAPVPMHLTVHIPIDVVRLIEVPIIFLAYLSLAC